MSQVMLLYASTVSWRRSVPVVVMATSSSWQRRDSDAWGSASVSTAVNSLPRWKRRCRKSTRTVSAVTPTCWTTPTERAPAKQRAISLYRTAIYSAPDRACRSSPCTWKQPFTVFQVSRYYIFSYHLLNDNKISDLRSLPTNHYRGIRLHLGEAEASSHIYVFHNFIFECSWLAPLML